MALTQKQLHDVCFVHGGNLTCRYLDEATGDAGEVIHVCKKLAPDRKIIEIELIDFLNEMKRTGQDPNKQGVALGDNCQGFLVLKTKQQGYDVKG